MAVCTECQREMLTATGCTAEKFAGFADGVIRDRIRYGDETRFTWPTVGTLQHDVLKQCHDCGVTLGQFHHPGCDVEECPKCHLQAISCACCDLTETS